MQQIELWPDLPATDERYTEPKRAPAIFNYLGNIPQKERVG